MMKPWEVSPWDVRPEDPWVFYGLLRDTNLDELGTVESCTFRGNMYSVGSFPAVVSPLEIGHTRVGRVVGTLWRPRDFPQPIVDAYRAALDRIEHFYPYDLDHSMYIRDMIEVLTESGERVGAWVYIWNAPTSGLDRVESGDWFDVAPRARKYVTLAP